MTVAELLQEVGRNQVIENKFFNYAHWDFSNCDFNGITKIVFNNCEFVNNFNFSNLTNENLDIKFQNCSFKIPLINYFNTIHCDQFHMENCSGESILFIDCIIIDLVIENTSISKDLSIVKCSIETLMIANIEDWYINSCYLDSQNIKEAGVHSSSNIDQLFLQGLQKAYISGNYKSVAFEVQNFETIEFSSLEKDENDLLPARIEKFNITDLAFSGHLTLNEIEIENFVLSNVSSSSGTIRLTEIFIENARFDDCSISSFYWNQVHFKTKLEIERCDFSGLKLTNVKWLPKKKVSKSYLDLPIDWLYSLRKKELTKRNLLFDKEELMMLQYERDTYRQLKAASIANHNHIEALDFYRNEMRLYWREIRINGGVTWYDRILVFINRWVSDFGQNWWLPLVWMFSIHTLIFFCIVGIDFNASSAEIQYGGGQYFELLNPVHKTPDYINGFYVGLELLMRVLNGFFIYHFIRATRKFSKL